MGNTTSAISGAATLDSFIGELSDIAFEKSLSSSRFLKCVRGRHQDGQVVVKLFVKAANVDLRRYIKQAQVEKDVLLEVPNALSYQRIQETERAVYLVRQYNASNLYDRVSTRPFLEAVEKRWIVFQLLTGLKDCHAQGIRHGDIKTENVLVTSWNWVYLTDFAFFKPTYLPENNPADFSYYFDTSLRRTCYLAPERFYGPSEQRSGDLTDAMDIFSLGCVIAELFLEGSPLFDLSQLFKYKSGEYDPRMLLDKIEDLEIRSLIGHMINLDPDKRHSAEGYLSKWQRRAFPHYFTTFLHEYISLVTDSQRHHLQAPCWDIDDALDRIFFDFDKISFFLKFDDQDGRPSARDQEKEQTLNGISIPNYRRSSLQRHMRTSADDGALIFLGILLSGVRNSRRQSTRVRACDTMLALSDRISDEAKLDRVVPFLMTLISDDAPEVTASALAALTEVLATVRVLTPVNAFIFPEYILKKLRENVLNSTTLVKVKYAQCIASLVRSAARFADMARALRDEEYLTLVDIGETETRSSGDKRFEIHLQSGKRDQETYLRQHILSLLADPESIVKRALLPSIPELSQLFGPHRANDFILGHLITYLNDKDWLLKAALFDHVVQLGQYLGRHSVEMFIVPFMVQATTDPEDFILEKVLTALGRLCQQNLILQPISTNLLVLVNRFLLHPNLWIREAATGYIATACTSISRADVFCIVYPLVRPFLRMDIVHLTSPAILQSLRRPLSQPVYEAARRWALDATGIKAGFWTLSANQQDFARDLLSFDTTQTAASFSKLLSSTPNKNGQPIASHERILTVKNPEDEAALAKLRGLGLRVEDDGKLLVLKEYISRVSKREKESSRIMPGEETLQKDKALPTTIFFDSLRQESIRDTLDVYKHDPTHDVQVALRDASLNLENGRARRNLRRVSTPSSSLAGAMLDRNREASSTINSRAHSLLNQDFHGKSTRIATLSSPKASVHSSADIDTPNGNAHVPKRQTSAVNLPGMSSKASAAVSTTNTIVMGQVDHHCAEATSTTVETANIPKQKRIAGHDYHGFDQTVLDALEKVYASTYPEATDLFTNDITVSPPRVLTKAEQNWKAEPVLVAHIQEHTAAINCVRVSPDHAFFVTCSDDGTIRVWDSGKLEKNVANRARLTYKGMSGTQIKAICFLQNSHCVAAASDQGVVHVLKIDCETSHSKPAKYGNIQLLRKYMLNPGESVTSMEHIVQNLQSLLILATNKSRIIALNVLSMTVQYVLENPAHHGNITCFCIDAQRMWLLIGTSRGILDLWDLRFQLRIKSIGLPHQRRVTNMLIHPTRGRSRWVCVSTAGTPEISVWDIEKSTCRERYRPHNCPIEADQQPYQDWDVENSTPESLMAKFSGELCTITQERDLVPIYTRAFVVAGDLQKGDQQPKSAGLSLISASTDQLIRRWDLYKIEQSTVMSGLHNEEDRPTYQSITNFNTAINEEVEAKSNHRSRKKTSRSATFSVQQNQLLRAHMDTILDLAYLQWPYKMVISVDRSGVLKVFA